MNCRTTGCDFRAFDEYTRLCGACKKKNNIINRARFVDFDNFNVEHWKSLNKIYVEKHQARLLRQLERDGLIHRHSKLCYTIKDNKPPHIER